MLIRPLSFKGPADHLSRFFSAELLFSGFEFLSNHSIDWRFDQSTGVVEASTSTESTLITTQIKWPLEENTFQCSCDAKSACQHVAATSLMSKVKFDLIATTPKDIKVEPKLIRKWATQIQQQSFDPFPNMARHRLVYLLKPNAEAKNWVVSVWKAYLTQDNHYQLKQPFELAKLNQKSLPKFVSDTDLQILSLLNKLDRFEKNDHQLTVSAESDDQWIELALGVQRLFYKSCAKAPIKLLFDQTDSESSLLLSQRFQMVVNTNSIRVTQDNPQVEQSLIGAINQSNPNDWYIELSQKNWVIENLPEPNKTLELLMIKHKKTDRPLSEFLPQLEALEPSQLEQIFNLLLQLNNFPSIKASEEWLLAKSVDLFDRNAKGELSQLLVFLTGLHLNNINVKIDAKLTISQSIASKWYGHIQSDNDWIDMELGVEIAGVSVNLLPAIVEWFKQNSQIKPQSELIRLHLKNEISISVEYRKIKSILDILAELKSKGALNQDKLRLAKHQSFRVLRLSEKLESIQLTADENLKRYAKQLTHLNFNIKSIPTELSLPLRNYQIQGVQWLKFLYDHQLSGILADDMGLGKTLQTLTFLSWLKQKKQLKQTALIVTPTSLLGNWLAEAKKFTPNLVLQIHYGQQRDQLDLFSEQPDIIVTSYGTLLRDINQWKTQSLSVVVLDEAQTIKNSSSQIYKMVMRLKARQRICLTGTPMENHIGELWSLMNFLMPDILGKKSDFNQFYRTPIEKDKDIDLLEELKKRVKPFILRRTKTEVATELPEKTEIIQSLELLPEQRNAYEAVRLAALEEVSKVLYQSKNNKLSIANALLRLRQICNHPNLLNIDTTQQFNSCKIEWLRNTLPEMIEEGRRVLIFSSFTSMLDLIEADLKSLNINCIKLTGKTQNRTSLVNQFQTLNFPVFLISLKAGGTGLNLTAADTVIHVDPWWNPAAENQASDRAYRIGQDKPVFVYKLICKDSVEEKIQIMQQNKSLLYEELISQTQNPLAELSSNDWVDLLQSPLYGNI